MMKKLDLNSITISLIIPTLNAAEYMPGLIDILGRQTCKPDEIIDRLRIRGCHSAYGRAGRL